MAALDAIAVPVVDGVVDLTSGAVAATLAGDTAPVGPGLFLYVNNADAGAHTVTIATPGTVSGLAITDATLVVAAGDHGIIPLANLFRGSNGRAAITYDAVTSVTVAVYELGS